MNDSWVEVLDRQMRDLEMVASWASIVGYGEVRDAVRIAISKIRARKENYISTKQPQEVA